MTTGERRFVFTLTAGRTGTAYLADLLRANIGDAEVHHEILGYNAFGVHTPDVSHLTQFNARGNTPHVQNFWRRKLGAIAARPVRRYVETSHVLMKAGLVENLAPLRKAGVVDLIILRRDPFDTVLSYRNRFDFLNKGNMWLWYLDPDYPRNLVNATAFRKMGINGVCLWYVCEIAVRAERYRLLLADDPKVRVHDVRLEALTDAAGVADLLDRLGAPRPAAEIELPPPANQSRVRVAMGEDERRRLRHLIETMDFDPQVLARRYLHDHPASAGSGK